MTKKEKLILLALALVQFSHIMDFMIMMPLGDTLMRIFSLSPGEFSALVSAYTFSAGIVGIASSFFMDRFDRKKALTVTFIGFLLGTFACGISPTYPLLLAARILTGAFGGLTGAIVLAIIGDVFPLEKRNKAMGYNMASFSLASVIGVPFGYYLAEKFVWSAPFLFLVALGIPTLVFIIKFIPNINEHLNKDVNAAKPKKLQVLINLLGDKQQQLAVLFMVFLMMGQFTVVPFIAPYMERNIGFSGEQITLIYLVGGGLTIFTAPLIGILADRFGTNKIFTIFALLNIIPIYWITNLGASPIWLALTATSTFFVFSSGRYIPAQTKITGVVKQQNRGSFMSITGSVQQIGAGIAALIAGLLVQVDPETKLFTGYDYSGYLAIFFTLIAIYVGRKITAKY